MASSAVLPTRKDEAWRYADLAALAPLWPLAEERIVLAAGEQRSMVLTNVGHAASARDVAVELGEGARLDLHVLNAPHAYGRIAVRAALAVNRQLVLMQCNTNYTGSLENFRHINLNVLKTYAARYPRVLLGLSDHSPGHATVLGAVIGGIASSAYAYGPGYYGPGYGYYGGYAPAYYGGYPAYGYAPAYRYAPAYYGGYAPVYYGPRYRRVIRPAYIYGPPRYYRARYYGW